MAKLILKFKFKVTDAIFKINTPIVINDTC
jgi:hypothetical protein